MTRPDPLVQRSNILRAVSLKLLTFNVKLIPSYAKTFIEPRVLPIGWWERDGWSDAERLPRIVEALKTSDADLIVLQELYQEGARATMRSELATAGYTFTSPKLGNDWLNEDSGLFVASRVGVRDLTFVEFDAKAGEDALSDKGMVRVRLDVSDHFDFDTMVVVGAHLQSSYNYHGIRKRQLQQMAALFASENAEHCIAFGDFNVRGETKSGDTWVQGWEHARMLTTLGARDLGYRAGEPDYTWDGVLNDAMTKPGDQSQKRLDYILALGSTLHGTAQAEPFKVEGRHLSDHFGVSATITMSP